MYLLKIRKDGDLTIKHKAHLWDGTDTVCRMASTGGLKMDTYKVFDSHNGKEICRICTGIYRGKGGDMGKVLRGDWSWKAGNLDAGFKKKVRFLKKKKQQEKNRVARSTKRQAAKDRQEKNKQIRDNLLRHFGLHGYTTWAGIADMICAESGIDLPDTDKGCKKLVLAYGRKQTRPHKEYKPRMSADKFYASIKWKELRYIALKNSGGCCTLCGARSSDGVTLHVDHIVPRSIDPRKEFDLDNLQILCDDCNIGKSNRDSIDWR